MTFKIRLRSPKSNKLVPPSKTMSLCKLGKNSSTGSENNTQESYWDADPNGICTKTICPTSLRLEGHKKGQTTFKIELYNANFDIFLLLNVLNCVLCIVTWIFYMRGQDARKIIVGNYFLVHYLIKLIMLFLLSADFFSKSTFSKNSVRNTIRVSNSLDRDQARHFVMPDLGPNCL